MESKLGLNMELVNQARQSAAKVADDVQVFIDQHTTVTVERAVCRLLGVDGVNDMDVPMPNVVVDHLLAVSLLPAGAAWAIGNAMVETGKDPQAVAEAVDSGELDLSKVPAHSDEEIRAVIDPVVRATVERINKNVAKRNAYLKEWGDREGPYLYIIVATGNIYEDIIQAKAGAKQGADIIAVIRTTGQSLLDYVPYGATTEGFGGTYATQENFRLMRAALDEVGARFEAGKLFLPQLLGAAQAAQAAFEPVKDALAHSGGARISRGTIVIATVKGDIHDIGKNIVKVLLENYSYDVLDLGKDVAPEAIVEETIKNHVRLVGLSALMTTTVPSMEETIKQLRKEAPWAKVMVGGAVLTQEYADMIGADAYCRDAMASVNYAQQVLV